MEFESKLEEPLLDAMEAARLLNVPRATVYELVRSRGLPYVRIGERSLRFTRSGLEEWVAANTYGRTGADLVQVDQSRHGRQHSGG
jgi:excisionase family DNA binding protein